MTRPAGIEYSGQGHTYRGTGDPCHPKIKTLSLLMETEGLDKLSEGLELCWRWLAPFLVLILALASGFWLWKMELSPPSRSDLHI
jgi:hypothetical protein